MKKSYDPLQQRIINDIEALLDKKLSPEHRSRIEVSLRLPQATLLHLQLVEFQRKLVARQRTITPDFTDLYKRKAEFDHQVFEREQ